MNCKISPALLGVAAISALTFSLIVAPTDASAHAVAIGHSQGTNAGQVNLFIGSYHPDNRGDGPNLEGSANLVGPNAYDTTNAFTTPYTVALPANLLLSNVSFSSGYSLSSIGSWEAVTVSGLTTAGNYIYNYVCTDCSQHWSPLSTSTTFALSAADIGGGGTSVGGGTVPEPMSLALVGLGMLGVALARRKQS